MVKRAKMDDPCGVGETIALFSGRWKGLIVWWLRSEPTRFNELRRRIPEVSPRVLTQQLRELEHDGIVSRTQFNEMPVRVEYALTVLGRALLPLLDKIKAWGEKHLPDVEDARADG